MEIHWSASVKDLYPLPFSNPIFPPLWPFPKWFGCEEALQRGSTHRHTGTYKDTHTCSHTPNDQSNRRNAASCTTSQLDCLRALAMSSSPPNRMKGHQPVRDTEGTPGIKKRGSSPARACWADDLGSLQKQRRRRKEREEGENLKNTLRQTPVINYDLQN